MKLAALTLFWRYRDKLWYAKVKMLLAQTGNDSAPLYWLSPSQTQDNKTGLLQEVGMKNTWKQMHVTDELILQRSFNSLIAFWYWNSAELNINININLCIASGLCFYLILYFNLPSA